MLLKDKNLLAGEENMMGALAQGPSWLITTWQAYDINEFTFCTKAKDKKSSNMMQGHRTWLNDTIRCFRPHDDDDLTSLFIVI
jgi:hypothetical protein